MSKKQEWEKVGGGSYGIYKQKKPDGDGIWGWVFAIGVAVFLLSMCS